MCDTRQVIELIRNNHTTAAQQATDWELEELNYHLAFEAETYMRMHEKRCEKCIAAEELAV